MDNTPFDPTAFNAGKVVAAPGLPHGSPNDAMVFSPKNYAAHQIAQEQQRADKLIALRQLPSGPVKTWSFSAMSVFKECPHHTYLTKVKKIKEPGSPAMDRGSAIHLDIEDFIQHKKDTLRPEPKKHFETFITNLRNRWGEEGPDVVRIEEEWAFTKDWKRTGWKDKDAWTRMKLDVFEHDSPTSAIIIDWKTGRKFGNELKHSRQLQLYCLASFIRFPELEFIEAKMIYIDHGTNLTDRYTREEAMLFLEEWELDAYKMTTATDFPATPSFNACRWCPHGKIQDGADAPVCPHKDSEL